MELSEDELVRRSDGRIVYPWWPKEKLQNEAATLKFVAENTSIPVPACRLCTKDGLLHLETRRITDGVLLEDLGPLRAAATESVEKQMNSTILPQLRAIRRHFIGSINENLPVPPPRIYGLDRRIWPQIRSEKDEFVLCHNDLGPQNIFVHPETFQIVEIIDWEFAGFFPSDFELPLWREVVLDDGREMYDAARPRDLAFFGLKEEDLQDCAVKPCN
ncbi:hypothetical protein TOPH_05005 [Tolypocladium ophioglossoides CBS 100239]|uniref:Aminoglycoside phosphotransferase domain-containing protein n=1 Tax=Tolypocladium ophioglossoides (strain CBS 100239) TaxID=1163406 RepID=A0A0L0N9L1_TOLOC|nr:hypothetical protein TOPH_05005 [Tolypocladium ophioglossoides CBS 100239]